MPPVRFGMLQDTTQRRRDNSLRYGVNSASVPASATPTKVRAVSKRSRRVARQPPGPAHWQNATATLRRSGPECTGRNTVCCRTCNKTRRRRGEVVARQNAASRNYAVSGRGWGNGNHRRAPAVQQRAMCTASRYYVADSTKCINRCLGRCGE